jgi:hypothetical protein
VAVDVVDLGLVKNDLFPNADGTAKWQHKIDIVWQSADLMDDGRPYLIKKRYTLSLGEKATLRHDLASWRGRDFTPSELEAFDVEKLIGVNAIINVAHKKGSRGGTFANVVSVMPLMKNQTKILPTIDYVRVCDRPKPEDTTDAPDHAPTDDDSEPPF